MFDTATNLNANEPRNQMLLHGGEPMLLPIEDFRNFMENLSKYREEKRPGHIHSGSKRGPGLMTSLAYLSQEHIDIIKKYKVDIGVSLDGPPEFNILRGPRDPKRNKVFQQTVLNNIDLLKKNKLKFGYITVMTAANASPDKIDKLIEWGVKKKISGRFNPMFVPWHEREREIKKYELTVDEVKNAFLKLAEATFEYPEFRFAQAHEFRGNLLGQPLAPCIVSRCDYLTTRCKAILADGSIARCDRCFQDGYYLASIDEPTMVRSEILRVTDCKGCRYFEICGGGCPGEPIDNDIRRKTRYCKAYYALYEYVEKRLRVFPDIILTTDVENYHAGYVQKHRPFEWWYNMFRKPGQKRFNPRSKTKTKTKEQKCFRN